MKHKPFTRILSLLLAVATLVGLLAVPASAASLNGSGTVTIQQAGFGNYLSKSTGGSIGGGYWKYTSNDGLTGTAYCVNWGLKGVSPSKSLTIQEYNRNPQTMGAFANGYPNRTLAQFKELHADDVRGIASLTEDEYKYATQVAVWASCGQLAVSGTSFTAGRASLVEPTADAQKIRIYDSVKAILRLANGWTKNLHTGLSVRAEEDKDVRGVDVLNEYGLEGAAADHEDGIKKETIGGKEYYTRTMYVASATSTWIDGRTTKVYSTDAPQGTIFTAENGSPLETVQENGATCYKVDTSKERSTNLNSNGSEYYGAFKVCVPVDTAAAEGSFTIKATGGVAQFNLFLAYNPSASEQSYIISDPGYVTLEAQAPFKWSGTDVPDTASLQIVKTGAGGAPLEGAEFTLTGDKGTTVTGKSDRNGQVVWTDLPAGEKFTLSETAAPEGYQVMAPIDIILTPGRTEYVTVPNESEKGFTVKKIDAQNKSSLPGAVFVFEQIDGSYKTTGITGFDGTISFQGDELPYGSYRVTEQSSAPGYLKDTRVETVEWTGERDVLLFSVIKDKDGKGKVLDVILPVTELDRANAIFERILYTLPPEPERRPAKPLQRGHEVFRERQAPEREAPEQAPVRRQERPKDKLRERQPPEQKKPVLQPQEAPVRPSQPQWEVSQRSAEQGRQEAPVAQRQGDKGKNGSRSERDSHVIKISSSIPKESGAARGTSERPSIAARLEGYRGQGKKQSAPAKVKAKAKSQAKAR